MSKKTIKELMNKNIRIKSKYILDEENAVAVYLNNFSDKDYYYMVHYRLDDDSIFKVNEWNQKDYRFGNNESEIIRDSKLLLVQGGYNYVHNSQCAHDRIYDYKKEKFIVEQGMWDDISYSANSVIRGIKGNFNFLDDYNCFVAHFKLQSTYDTDEYEEYFNPITGEKDIYYFTVSDPIYFALLNRDGTIRNNILFVGEDFKNIEKIIKLDEYESLEQFKNIRKEELNKQKEKRRKAFYRNLKNGNLLSKNEQVVIKTLKNDDNSK